MKSCFVIQGYGRKTDYRDGRVLDLDASYAIIKDAVEAAGLECTRADEIQRSGTIDLPMYEWLLNADLVVADLSTYHSNVVFELGVRYALRPHATIMSPKSSSRTPSTSATSPSAAASIWVTTSAPRRRSASATS
jgi:hypothetical protein